ncbi:hypothetical protein ACFL59_04150 [Planctomycetota bacterium]
MTRDEAIGVVEKAHSAGEVRAEEAEPLDAERCYIELIADRNTPGPIRNILCWRVRYFNESGPVVDVYVEEPTGEIVRQERW